MSETARKITGFETNKYGDWIREEDGTLSYKNDTYVIEGSRLTEIDWIPHMREKTWINMHDFINAYLDALISQGIKEITIKVY